jgi:hypothetical protein
LRSFTRSGRSADTDHRDSTGELCQPLLQLLLVVLRCGLLDLRLDLGERASISIFLPAPLTMTVFSLSMASFSARPEHG